MRDGERFPFVTANPNLGEASLLPELPLTLTYQGRTLSATGLLDTGATVNVLPWPLGLELGARWNPQAPAVKLTGNLAQFEAQPLIASAVINDFQSVRLVFAWTQNDSVPLILGQVNFFMEFEVCFYRARQFFDVRPRTRKV